MLTADDDAERKADLLDLGAADYVTKPFHPRELLARVRVHLRICQLTAALRAANGRLTELSVTDALTGLANRTLFHEVLDDLLAQPDADTHVGVIAVDLDGFKGLNDRFGHAIGDSALVHVAGVLRAATGGRGTVARLGGDEFVIAVQDPDCSKALFEIAAAIHDGMRVPLAVKRHQIQMAASLGIATVDGPLLIGPWALQHEPAPVPGAYALAGHVHPGIVVGGRSFDRLRLPCFHFGAQVRRNLALRKNLFAFWAGKIRQFVKQKAYHLIHHGFPEFGFAGAL